MLGPTAATFRNRLPYENLPADEGGPNDLAETKRICEFFRTEIDRIIDDLSEEYIP